MRPALVVGGDEAAGQSCRGEELVRAHRRHAATARHVQVSIDTYTLTLDLTCVRDRVIAVGDEGGLRV